MSLAAPRDSVLVLGGGYTASRVLALAQQRGLVARAIVRRAETADALRAAGVDALVRPELGADVREEVDEGTHVVVTFPPDGATDRRIALPRVGEGLRALTYLSATSVYGDRAGVITDDTPVATEPSPAGARRLEAESLYRARGATVLRCPSIYGPDRGLHVRIARGQHKIPGDGSGYVSRIHVEDLAALVLAAPRAPGETFVVGDLEPAAHRDVVAFVCRTHGLPLPPSVPLAEVHETLRGDRSIDASRVLRVLGVALRYPSYRDGMASGTVAAR